MPSDLLLPTLLLLHEGGWDEVIMVAAGLGIAYLIIVWSGRNKSQDDDDEWEDDEEGDSSDAAATDQASERPPTSRP